MQWSRGHVVWSSNGISFLQADSDCEWQHGQVSLILHIDMKKAGARSGCNDESSNKLEQEAALKDSRLEKAWFEKRRGNQICNELLSPTRSE